MASAEATEVFNCTQEQFYSIITDFESYSKFLSEVEDCRVVEDLGGNEKIVEYHVKVVKPFAYRLLMKFDEPHSLTWTFDSGDLFKVSNGSWHLQDVDGKTKATYRVEASFKMFVPGPIAKALVSVNLPNMMASYHKRVASLFNKV
ncbi:MAG: SRPBCC family protein [Bdellovibrionales bacterium]|nr:SRPBCC family protein [Bdellovibrionales bacterium]